MTDTISLHGLRVRGFHGVLPEERSVGQLFVADVTLEVDTAAAAAADDLDLTVDYSVLAHQLAEIIGGEPEHPEPGIHREAAERDQRRREIEQAQAPVGALAGRQRGAAARTSRRTNPTARRASATARAGAFTPTSAADSSGWSSVEIVT